MFWYKEYQQSMFSHPSHQQFPPSFHTFASHENMFSALSNIFVTSTMTPPSTYRSLSPSHCYHPSMPHKGLIIHHLTKTNRNLLTIVHNKPNLCLHDDHKSREGDHHVTPLLIVLFHLCNKKQSHYLCECRYFCFFIILVSINLYIQISSIQTIKNTT